MDPRMDPKFPPMDTKAVSFDLFFFLPIILQPIPVPEKTSYKVLRTGLGTRMIVRE